MLKTESTRSQRAGPPPPPTPIRLSTFISMTSTPMAIADTPTVDVEVTAKIPEATDYEHIHFGVWAALDDAEKDGSQEIDGLGIGFVQNFSGSGMTGADMPNNGECRLTRATGSLAVQAEDEDGNGDISLEHGVATIAADFGEGDITATLTDLATLTGAIAGNTVLGHEGYCYRLSGLDTSADFEGTFNGAFYGAKGAEAGGVFDFASEDNEGGAFRGAFGGRSSNRLTLLEPHQGARSGNGSGAFFFSIPTVH